MKFATLSAVVAVAQAAYTLETPDDGAAAWDENNADDSLTACSCITVAEVAGEYAQEQSSTDCTTYTCDEDTTGDGAADTYTWTDDDFSAVLTTAGYAADYGDSCQNWDKDQAWCDEDDSSYDADADVTDFCDEDFIWCWVNSDCDLAIVNTDFASDAAYSTVAFAQCNSATKVLATMSAALAAAVITM